MGACLSCLGLRKDSEEVEHQRLLYDDPYANQTPNYGSWSQSSVPAQNLMSPDEVRREQQALNEITRWASDQIVEIFPHRNNLNASTISQPLEHISTTTSNGMTASAHQDILLSMIPGDKSKRSIRIYPASRPSSRADADSARSKTSMTKIPGGADGAGSTRGKGVFVKLNVELP